MKNGKRQIKRRRIKIAIKIFDIFIKLGIVGAIILAFVLYGPFNGFRDWLVTVSLTSMSHQWIAEMLYSEDTIKQVLANNRVEEIKEDTDTNSVNTNAIKEEEKQEKENDEENDEKPKEIVYENEYEKQILCKDLDKDKYNIYAEDDLYRIIRIKGSGYTGYLAVVYDPSKIRTLVTNQLGTMGQYLTDMSKENNAIISVNGGRFYDPQYKGNGSKPRGVTYSDGVCRAAYAYSKTGGIIGFNKDDVLVLSSTCTKESAEALNIRDCVTCGPFLIVNGKTSTVYGNGGWGTAPRTAIGQRKDGIVLLLVLDGRIIGRPGATMDDLIEIMQNYGAYTAANLDGGTSTAMALNGKIINDPVDASGTHRTRHIATAFGLIDE